MMNNEERIRAMLVNLKNYPWDIYPVYRIEKEDAEALLDYIRQHDEVLAKIL